MKQSVLLASIMLILGLVISCTSIFLLLTQLGFGTQDTRAHILIDGEGCAPIETQIIIEYKREGRSLDFFVPNDCAHEPHIRVTRRPSELKVDEGILWTPSKSANNHEWELRLPQPSIVGFTLEEVLTQSAVGYQVDLVVSTPSPKQPGERPSSPAVHLILGVPPGVTLIDPYPSVIGVSTGNVTRYIDYEIVADTSSNHIATFVLKFSDENVVANRELMTILISTVFGIGLTITVESILKIISSIMRIIANTQRSSR